MGIFENKKRSEMVLTGVVLSSSIVNTACQGVAGAGKAVSAQGNLTGNVMDLIKDYRVKVNLFLMANIATNFVASVFLVYLVYKMCSSRKGGNVKKAEKEEIENKVNVEMQKKDVRRKKEVKLEIPIKAVFVKNRIEKKNTQKDNNIDDKKFSGGK